MHNGTRRPLGMAAGLALAGMAITAMNAIGPGPTMNAVGPGPVANGIPAPLAPTTSNSPSITPSHPVDCNDPRNSINCQTAPIDSPLVSGSASPGSPFRD